VIRVPQGPSGRITNVVEWDWMWKILKEEAGRLLGRFFMIRECDHDIEVEIRGQ
jgi:hypothetical protein